MKVLTGDMIEYIKSLDGGLKRVASMEIAREEVQGITIHDNARGHEVPGAFFVHGSDEAFGVSYKLTCEGQRAEFLSFWSDERFTQSSCQVAEVLKNIDLSVLHSCLYINVATKDSWDNPECPTEKIRRRIEDRLRKTSSREEIIKIAELLGVRTTL